MGLLLASGRGVGVGGGATLAFFVLASTETLSNSLCPGPYHL